jgi:hypothetical protein
VEGDHTGVVFALGFTFGTVAGVGFAGTLSADLGSDAAGGAAAGLLEHAAQTPRSAIERQLLKPAALISSTIGARALARISGTLLQCSGILIH